MVNGEQQSYYHTGEHIYMQMPVCIYKQMFQNLFCMLKATSCRQEETDLKECILCNTAKKL